MGLYAPDGSYRVTVTDGDGTMPVAVNDSRVGLYARDGSYRVTVVSADGLSVLVTNGDSVTIGGTTYTFTVSDGAITAIATA